MFRMFDRRLLLFAFIGSAWTVALSGQTSPAVNELIRGLRDSDHGRRMSAVESAVAEVRNGRVSRLLDDRDFEKALFGVVHDINDRDRQLARNPDPKESLEEEEGRADEMNLLAELFVPTVPSLSADRQRAWAPELIRSLATPGLLARWLAEFGDLAVDALIEKINQPEIPDDRTHARAVLAHMAAVTAAGPSSRQTRQPLSVANRQKVLKVVRDGLDVNDRSAVEIVRAYQRVPSSEGLATLQEFSRRSRGKPEYSRRLHPRLKSLQEEVDDTIQEIQAKLR